MGCLSLLFSWGGPQAEMSKSGRVIVLTEWMEEVLKPPKELTHCTTPPHVFLQHFKQPSSSQPFLPYCMLHCAGTAVSLAVGGPGVGRSSWRGGRAAYASFSSSAAEDPQKVLKRQDPPIFRSDLKHLVGNSHCIPDAIVWSLLVDVACSWRLLCIGFQ